MNKFKFKAGDNVEINTFGHCPGWDGKSGIIVESDCNSRNPLFGVDISGNIGYFYTSELKPAGGPW